MSGGVNRTIVSWTRFCEWVQGKTVRGERDEHAVTEVVFEDGTEAVFYSRHDVRFGEKMSTPPMVEIVEAWEP